MASELADDARELRQKVREAYAGAAQVPAGKHPFPVGRAFAESLGYPAATLDRMPPGAVDSFAGVSNIAISAKLKRGARVLDLGCGAGLDSLIAAERVGARGIVLGIDFGAEMLAQARAAARAAGASNVIFCQADAERLPLRSESIDAALVNGIFNLNPAREAIFSELARVMKPGGELWAAELIVREPLPAEELASAANWFA
ncbi:MAG TPA: methyltransferase domain-containing protein [Candidatus Binataceae bacterium]|nr:methyltransferase domain-containing protein [Candidatus Binataceae bacterium]